MSFFDSILKKEQKNIGVCIPEHAKKTKKEKTKESNENTQIQAAVIKKNLFEVEGIFAVKTTVNVIGKVKSGTITKGMKLISFDKKLKINAIEIKGKKVKEAKEGQKALIRFNEFPGNIIIGSILEFQ
jgi:hypothetical protein